MKGGRVGRAVARRELGGHEPLVDLVTDAGQRQPVGGVQRPADAEVARVVDGGLGSERTSLLEILLDLAVLVVRLQLRLHAVVNDAGAEPTWGAAGDLATEHDLHVVGTPERELVAERELKPVADVVRTREHAGVGEFHLPDREAIAVAALAILSSQRRGQPGLPILPEPLDVAPTQGGAYPASASASWTERNPLSSASNEIARFSAWRLAHSCPLR